MNDTAIWGFFTAIVSGIFLVLVEQVRGRYATQSVKREVVNTKTEATDGLAVLSGKIDEINNRLDRHIAWHLEGNDYVRLRGR